MSKFCECKTDMRQLYHSDKCANCGKVVTRSLKHPEPVGHEFLNAQISDLLIKHIKFVKDRVKYKMESGAIDLESYPKDPENYLLAKVLITAALRDTCDSFEPGGVLIASDLENLKYI